MNKGPIGGTGLSVPTLCFGTSPLASMPASYGYEVSEARARETLHAMLDSPVRFLDTSNNYGFGRGEERIGAVLRERGGLPEGFVLSTKVDRDSDSGRFDAARVRQSLEESLSRLGLDRVHILHLHDPEYASDLSEVTAAGGALDELFKMKEEGLAQAVGLAMGRLDIMSAILPDWPFDALISHNRFTLLNRSADAVFDAAAKRGIAVLNAAPYAGGILAKGSSETNRVTYQPASGEALAPVLAIEDICAGHGLPVGALALQFSQRDPRVTSTIVGVSKTERVMETLDWASHEIPEAVWEEIADLPYDSGDPEASRDYELG